MYLIVVYDVEAERTEKFKKFCRSRLNHVQNSVFEGEVTEKQYKEIRDKLKEMSKENESILIYQMWSDDYVNRHVFGEDPVPDSNYSL
jgi:CRISPR-associated protein Cas2